MNKEELIIGFFEKGYCCNLDEVKNTCLDLLKENQELKKQVEQYKGSQIANYNQQKEFINYLEDEINKLKEQIKNYDIWHEVGTDINFLILKKQFYLEILQKYQETIGVSDDNKTTI